MKNRLNLLKWENAHKVATVLGIIGGIYLISVNVIKPLFFNNHSFSSSLTIEEYELPKRLNYKNFRKIQNSIPIEINRYDISLKMYDSILSNFPNSNIDEFKLRRVLENSIPKEIDYSKLKKKVDSVFNETIYPINNSSYFVETSIENIGKNIAKNVRLEISSSGYFELYENGNLISNDDFENNIILGDIRVENKFTVKAWCFNYVNTNKIRFTYEEGVINPNLKEIISKKGIQYWIYKNSFLSIYLIVCLLYAAFYLGIKYNY